VVLIAVIEVEVAPIGVRRLVGGTKVMGVGEGVGKAARLRPSRREPRRANRFSTGPCQSQSPRPGRIGNNVSDMVAIEMPG
jgi:hypothetical protein